MKESKIIIGANFGDEGKGMTTNFFCQDAISRGLKPIVIFHNGTAQRGHTVDFTESLRHVYHHFGSGTSNSVPTYFAETFFIHPMTYFKEYKQLRQEKLLPRNLKGYVDPKAKVITPFDMLVDHATEEYIAIQNGGEREFGSCGFGSWCAIEDRQKDIFISSKYTVQDFYTANSEKINFMMDQIWKDCLVILAGRGVQIDKLKTYKEYFTDINYKNSLINNFKFDLRFFFQYNELATFATIYSLYDSFIFENGQGLGLDFYYDKIWHTTSRTGILNPKEILKDYSVAADVCYVTRSYTTRHGEGGLYQEAPKKEINKNMIDRTNVFNDFQGGLRYGVLNEKDLFSRIQSDWGIVENDNRFNKKIIITHCNEFKPTFEGDYYSYNPYGLEENK